MTEISLLPAPRNLRSHHGNCFPRRFHRPDRTCDYRRRLIAVCGTPIPQLSFPMTVTPVSDPCVGNLATPVNSGYFIKALISNLPLYRPGISPNFRGLETGAAFGYLLWPVHHLRPTARHRIPADGRPACAIGAVHILSLLFLLYNQPGKQPHIPPADVTVENPLRICSPAPVGPTSPAASGWVVAVAPSSPGSSATPCTFRICSRSLPVFWSVG